MKETKKERKRKKKEGSAGPDRLDRRYGWNGDGWNGCTEVCFVHERRMADGDGFRSAHK